MINYIWIAMIISGLIFSIINGTLQDVNEALLSSTHEAIRLCIHLSGIFIFWLGLMKVAEKAGLLKKIEKTLTPLIIIIFPDLKNHKKVIPFIVGNITANMFGLGNAATPLGLKAMKEMKALSPNNEASRSMITFLALNTSGLTILPTTVIAIRMSYQSTMPSAIIMTTIIATITSTIAALLCDRYFYYRSLNRSYKR
ncbi:MAG TPA: nucleoside recognition domain-containing protein [Pseudogracilibacillus sp.]|nr:nucleoside recognition domain-containing protein [Pseudogracilibacillus sp.]